MAALGNIANLRLFSSARTSTTARTRRSTTTYRCARISCSVDPALAWDPEGILGPPQTGHIARKEFQTRLEKDSSAREAYERQVREEQERRQAARQARVIPDNIEGLMEYFLDTEARELEFEIARLRPRLNKEFFAHLKFELGQLRFAVSRTKGMEDRLVELEAMEKVLMEGTEAYDKLQADILTTRNSLGKILRSTDVKATLLEMVEANEINKSLLALLDENIATAHLSDQREAAFFMERVRAALLKYITA